MQRRAYPLCSLLFAEADLAVCSDHLFGAVRKRTVGTVEEKYTEIYGKKYLCVCVWVYVFIYTHTANEFIAMMRGGRADNVALYTANNRRRRRTWLVVPSEALSPTSYTYDHLGYIQVLHISHWCVHVVVYVVFLSELSVTPRKYSAE